MSHWIFTTEGLVTVFRTPQKASLLAARLIWTAWEPVDTTVFSTLPMLAVPPGDTCQGPFARSWFWRAPKVNVGPSNPPLSYTTWAPARPETPMRQTHAKRANADLFM